ncbi:MAG: PRC-barrel domain containing protein, partial [Bacteroidales bacterium]|nr:PRC-barrel domain containing protein [Bacteroidales bacterium]
TGNWLVGRQVLISPYSLVGISDDEENIVVSLTEKQIEECPLLDSDKPVSRQFEESYFDYFKLPAYWNGRYMWGAWPYIMREEQVRLEDKEELKSWDPNLRSTKSVTDYHIEATDGEIGHVEDFIIDDETWAIRYLVIDTKNWWGGKKVLISPQWIDRISWDESKVFVNLSKERIKQSPEYSEDILITRDYEDQLHKHYNQKRYWAE